MRILIILLILVSSLAFSKEKFKFGKKEKQELLNVSQSSLYKYNDHEDFVVCKKSIANAYQLLESNMQDKNTDIRTAIAFQLYAFAESKPGDLNWYCAALAYWGAGKYELAYKAAMKIEKVQPRHSVLLGQSLLQLSNSDSKNVLAHFYVAAATGEVESLYQIARFARWGQGVRKDCGFALKLNKILAEANSEKAAFEVAAIYSLGECVRKNELESSKWLIKSADLGFRTAAYMMASRYYHGTNGFVRDESKALEYADIAIASNDERGFGLKGLLLVEGKLKLYKKGYELLKKSSNLGDKDANRYLNLKKLHCFDIGEDDDLAICVYHPLFKSHFYQLTKVNDIENPIFHLIDDDVENVNIQSRTGKVTGGCKAISELSGTTPIEKGRDCEFFLDGKPFGKKYSWNWKELE